MISGPASPGPSIPALGDAEVFVFPASDAQRRLWFIQQLDGAATAYNEAFALRLRGELDPEPLQQALHWLEQRHESLHTVFSLEAGEPVQVIRKPTGIPLAVEDLAQLGPGAEAVARQRAEAMTARRFDLETGPLIRAGLTRLAPADHLLVIGMHHIIMDDWTTQILKREILQAYDAFRSGRTPQLAPPPIQYADYAVWQREDSRTTAARSQLETWRNRLAPPLPALELPTDRPRPPEQTFRGARIARRISERDTEALRRLTSEERVTLSTTLLTAFQVLLSRHTGQTDLVVGMPATNRTRAETEGVAGFFLNMLPIRGDLSGNPSFRELLGRFRGVLHEALGAQDVPFEQLVDLVRAPRDWSRNPLFQVVFAMIPAEAPLPVLGGLAVESWPVKGQGESKFDLFLSVRERGAGLETVFEFNTDLFDRSSVEEWADRFGILLQSIVADADQGVARLNLLPAAERRRLLVEWNETAAPYPRETGIPDLFEQQARATPDARAVESAAGNLSYAELDAAANRLAHRLRAHGVAPGASVGIMAERSPAQLVALLGILKAGGAYVPLDVSYPPARIGTLIADTRLGVVVVDRADRAVPGVVRVMVDDLAAPGDDAAGPPPGRNTTAESPAYVLFTSGSTGVPKGVVVPHRAVVRLVRGTDYVPAAAFGRVLGFAPLSFDASTFEIWGPLLNGGTLVLAPDGPVSLTELGEFIDQKAIATVWLTAALFHEMVDRAIGAISGLRFLLAGGDVLSPAHVRRLREVAPECRLINGYGPTENTTFTCCHRVPDNPGLGPIPIGRPVANTTVYILDDELELAPRGAIGELFAGGDGLALGYCHRPELTAERFVPHPFHSGERLYRTGDRVRYRNDGTIEFHGRKDDQVKVRGFRVEPGEVEAALVAHPEVASAAVVARVHQGDRRLAGYYTSRSGRPADPKSLRQFLRDRLPEFMVPAQLIHLDALPVSPNGKVDRIALPEPMRQPSRPAPHSALEQRLLPLWEEVLGLTGIGTDDNFFELGGNSLLGIRLLAGLERALEQRIPVSVLFQGQTIETMAAALAAGLDSGSSRVVAIQSRGSRLPLFVIPGVGGSLLGYQDLAAAFGGDQPLYGLGSRGLEGEAKPLDQAETIATDLLAELRRTQPRGPYQLVGFCMGGIVAYEMAQQLTALGEQVALLAMVETWPPETITDKLPTTRFMQHLRFLGQGALHHWRAMRQQPPGQRLRYLREKSKIIAEMVERRDVYRGDRYPLHRELVTRANQHAAASYVPAPYDGDVTLVLGQVKGLQLEDDPRLRWRKLAGGTCHVIHLPAKDSGAFLRQPNVQRLADALRAQLRRAP